MKLPETRMESGALNPSDRSLFWNCNIQASRTNEADLDHRDLDHRIAVVDKRRRELDQQAAARAGHGGQAPWLAAVVWGPDGWDDPDRVALDDD